MDLKWLESIVPPQQKGQSTTTVSRKKSRTNEMAHEQFSIATQRLLDVNKWHEYAGKGTASFQLTDHKGVPVNRLARQGDYFSIDIPGPGNPAGDGKDWVQVQEIGSKMISNRQVVWLKVRAGRNPLQDTNEPIHFLEEDATSTFVVYKEDLIVAAAVLGRNEHANVQAPNLLTRLRNQLIYIGAMLGFSKLQWKRLTLGLLEQSP